MSAANQERSKLFSKLRSQGLAFKTKVAGSKPTESGSETGTGPNAQTEGGSETSGVRILKKKTREGEDSGDVDLGLKVAALAPGKKKARIEKMGTEPAGVERTGPEPAMVEKAGPDTSGVIVTEIGGTAPEKTLDAVESAGTGAGTPAGGNPPTTAMVSGVETPREKAPISGAIAVPGTSPPRAPARKEITIGKKTLGELAGMAASIADDRELKKMEGHSLLDIYRGRLALWAQEGMLLAADRPTITRGKEQMQRMSAEISEKDKQLAEAREEVKEKDKLLAEAQEALREEKLQVLLRAQVNEQLQGVNRKLQEANEKLQDQLNELYAQEHILKEKLKHAGERESDLKDRVGKAEEEAVVQKRRVVELETELDGRRPEHVVIQEYKESEEYSDALMGAVAAELERCWMVTKKLTMAEPNHSYDDFCDAFEAAEGKPE